MKLNEHIMRIIDWPIKQMKRLKDWLEEGMPAASNNDREITPLERRAYIMGESRLGESKLIIGFKSLDDCVKAHDFLNHHYPKLKTPEDKS